MKTYAAKSPRQTAATPTHSRQRDLILKGLLLLKIELVRNLLLTC